MLEPLVIFHPQRKATRAFYIIMAPAVLIAILYLGIGIHPAPRALVGIVLFAALAWFLFGRKKKPRASG